MPKITTSLNRALLFSIGGLSLTAAASLPALLASAGDFTSLPPTPLELGKPIVDNKVTLSAAVRTAQGATGGLAGAAVSHGDSYTIDVFGDFGGKTVTVSASTGKIVDESEMPWLPGAQPTGDWVTTDSGLRYAVIMPGNGETPSGSDATVEVHYSGWLVDGTLFDSSVDRDQTSTFPLNRVIAGWTEGVASMKVGEKRKFIIPHNLGYGAAGRAPIPPRATLIFDIELIALL
jgi:hypothetical protein